MKKIKCNKNIIVLVDNNFKWDRKITIGGNGYPTINYVYENGKRENIPLYRYIMKAKKGQEIDHINRNPLDNRKCNLRFSTRQLQMYNAKKLKNNSSGQKGVYWNSHLKAWMVDIRTPKKRICSYYKDNKYKAIKKAKEIYRKIYAEHKIIL